jgi:hypothetical protein
MFHSTFCMNEPFQVIYLSTMMHARFAREEQEGRQLYLRTVSMDNWYLWTVSMDCFLQALLCNTTLLLPQHLTTLTNNFRTFSILARVNNLFCPPE